MNKRLKLVLSCILAVAAAAPAQGENLLDVYKLALQSDPLIREADATRMAAKEAKPQAWAALLPQIQGDASANRAESDSGGNRLVDIVNGVPLLTGRNESGATVESHEWSISLRQTIFRWDQWQTLKRADAQVAQAEANYRAAEQDLIYRVVQRYFAVLYAKDLVDTRDAAVAAFTRQLEQNEKRFEVGLIAVTDVQESRAQRDRANADLIEAKRTLATNHELLRELTGQDIATLVAPGEAMPLNAPMPADVETWVSAAKEQNLALIAARLGEEVANRNVGIARSGHLPTLSLGARYRDAGDDTTTTSRGASFDTFSDNTSSSVGLTLTVPIWASGGTQSVVRQNLQNQRAATERVHRITRETERSVRDNYLGVLSNISRVQALKQALESSKTSLQATQAGFEVGTRTTVDVLIAQQALFNAQAEYYQSRYNYIGTRVLLEQAAGQLTAQDLETINGMLQQ